MALLFFLPLCLKVFLWQGECFADFSFVVMGDSRSEHGEEAGLNQDVLSKLANLIKSDEPEFIVFVGDLICSSNAQDIEGLRAYFRNWKGIMDETGVPVYVSVGNEDIDKYGAQAEDVVREVFNMTDLFYSFDFDNAHFVVMDTAIDGQQGLIGDKQVEWVKLDFKQNKHDAVFVFGHHPFFPQRKHIGDSVDKYPKVRDALWFLFKESGIDIYFCGHEHFFHRDLQGGILQVITGGAGAPLHSSPDEEGGFYHYCLVTVRNDGFCHIRVKDIDGEIRDDSRLSVH